MVLEKQDGGVCLSTTEPNCRMTSRMSIPSSAKTMMTPPTPMTSLTTTTAEGPNSFDEQLPSLAATVTVDIERRQPIVFDSVFTFPVPDANAATTTTDDSRSTTPTTENPEVAWPTSMADVTGDCASSSSVVDSGLGSRCSPASSCDWQALTPLTQPSTPSMETVRSPTPVASAGEHASKRSSFTQRLMGMFNKSADKVQKSPKNQNIRSPQNIMPTTAAAAKDQKIISIMMERKEAERRQEEQRSRLYVTQKSDIKDAPSVRLVGQPKSDLRTTPSPAATGADRGAMSRTSCVRPHLTTSGAAPGQPINDGLATASPADSRRTSVYSTTAISAIDARIIPLDATRMKFAQKTDKRRQSVEQRLEQQRREYEEHQKQMKLKQEQELQRAYSLRLSRDQQQALRARMANERVQQKHEMISRQRQQSVNDLSTRREEIDARLAAAEAKAQKMKEEEMAKNRTELQKRFECSRQRQRQMEAELENWQQELLKFNQWQGDNAEKAARQASAARSAAACRSRLEKEKKQQDNMKRLMTTEEKRQAEMEAAIESKEARARALQREKDEQIQRSRTRAMAMKQMRDELRAHYSMNDLDQLARQVVLENRLLSRLPESSAQSSLMNSMASLI